MTNFRNAPRRAFVLLQNQLFDANHARHWTGSPLCDKHLIGEIASFIQYEEPFCAALDND
jgi:hypothetical protein